MKLAIISIFIIIPFILHPAATSHFNELIKVAAENDFKAVGNGRFRKFDGLSSLFPKLKKYNGDIKKKAEKPKKKVKSLLKHLWFQFWVVNFISSERPEQKQFTKDDPDRRTNMVLLAKNFQGYKNLAKNFRV